MIEPTDKDVGRVVFFHPRCSCKRELPKQRGVIQRFNPNWVWVVFDKDEKKIPTATSRRDLSWDGVLRTRPQSMFNKPISRPNFPGVVDEAPS